MNLAECTERLVEAAHELCDVVFDANESAVIDAEKVGEEIAFFDRKTTSKRIDEERNRRGDITGPTQDLREALRNFESARRAQSMKEDR